MSFSGYDSDAVGFDSVTRCKPADADNSTQTFELYHPDVGTQTNAQQNRATATDLHDLNAGEETLKEYPPPGLNDFLRRVVPSMLEQLDMNENEKTTNSSDSDEEETISARPFQEIHLNSVNLSSIDAKGAGDQIPAAILDLSWSSAGNSLAVSLGRTHHEEWCQHDGLIKIYTTKRSEGDKLVHIHDIHEKSCVTVLKYHPGLAALLAYGTSSGEIVVCNLRNMNFDGSMQIVSPADCHGSKRISYLQWADAALANSFLALKLTGKRRGATDQVLVSAGSDGKINIWQINVNLNVFQNIICYQLNGAKKTLPADITCFDFMKTYSDDEIFVVGTKSGEILICRTRSHQTIVDSTAVDPVCDTFEQHATCILNVSFSTDKPGVFASISMDSELRFYDLAQPSPLKVLHLDEAISSMIWLPNPQLMVMGLAKVDKQGQMLKVYNVSSEHSVPIEGLTRGDEVDAVSVTAMDLQHCSICRVAAGDSTGAVRVWDIPIRRIKINKNTNI